MLPTTATCNLYGFSSCRRECKHQRQCQLDATDLATMNGYVQIVKLLIDNGANVNVADRLGRTALSIARSRERTSVVKLLEATGARE